MALKSVHLSSRASGSALRARAAPAAPKLAVPSTSRVQRCRTSALPSDATPGPLASLTQALAAVPKVAMVPLAVMVLLGSTGGALAKDEGTLDTLTGATRAKDVPAKLLEKDLPRTERVNTRQPTDAVKQATVEVQEVVRDQAKAAADSAGETGEAAAEGLKAQLAQVKTILGIK